MSVRQEPHLISSQRATERPGRSKIVHHFTSFRTPRSGFEALTEELRYQERVVEVWLGCDKLDSRRLYCLIRVGTNILRKAEKIYDGPCEATLVESRILIFDPQLLHLENPKQAQQPECSLNDPHRDGNANAN